ncbi:serine hydrolase [Marinoscillum sp.]|uniref:serine hydrolase n=1 Tax=Marinoscillum sp. TaxID=2024838 RepID=UPI003BABA16A
MNSLRTLLIPFLCLWLLGACATKQEQAFIPNQTVKQYLDQVYNAYPLPGLAVVVVSGDQVYSYTNGYRQMKDSLPFNQETMFFAGELSEVMVAAAAVQFERQGKLQLSDQVSLHIPYFQMDGDYKGITLHHLLTHTSGIPNFSPAWDMPAFDEEALAATTQSIVYQPMEFEAGTRVKRSPYNIDIAADLLQHVGQLPFEQVMQEHYLNPLRLGRSTFDFRQLDSTNLAMPHHIGHWLTYEQRVNEIYPYTRENVGSYGFHTSVNDLQKWMQWILNNQPAGLLDAHYKTGKDTYKGYGWDIFRSDGDFIYNSHWGAGGFSADMSLVPEKQLGVFVWTNTMDDFNPALISSRLIGLLRGKELTPVKPPVHIAMSKMLAEGRCMEEVLAWFETESEKTGSLYEMNPTLLGQLGVNLLHRLQMQEQAMQVFELAVAKYPDSPQAYLNLAEGLLISGEIQQAKEVFDRAIAMNAPPSAYVTFLGERIAVEIENQKNT